MQILLCNIVVGASATGCASLTLEKTTSKEPICYVPVGFGPKENALLIKNMLALVYLQNIIPDIEQVNENFMPEQKLSNAK